MQIASFDDAGMEQGYQFGWNAALDNLAKEFAANDQTHLTHATFVIEREYAHPPAKVFAAYADPQSKAKWFVGPDEWEKSNHQLDFRVGGKESISGGPPGGPLHSYNATIWDIVENERIVSPTTCIWTRHAYPSRSATTEIKPGRRHQAHLHRARRLSRRLRRSGKTRRRHPGTANPARRLPEHVSRK